MKIAEIQASNMPTLVANSRNSLFTNATAANPIGSAGRNILRSDGIGNFDFGAFKNIKVYEQHRVIPETSEFPSRASTPAAESSTRSAILVRRIH